jgi:arylsulfatase A-like enzyme
VRLTNYHVGPTCAPTRSGLFTGHYANSTGVWHTIGGRSLLRGNEITLPSVLKENGYRTGLFGKWHLGDNYPYRPQDRGFETVVMHGGGGISQVPDYWGNDYFDDTFFVNGAPKRFEGYCTDVFFREAFCFIQTHREEPFFCCITTNAPHSPYNVEEKYRDLYTDRVPKDGKEDDRARFYGMITNIDENLGRLYTLLEKEELLDNTILIFMTDNGTSCGGPGYHTCGLRGYKNSEYDGGHRVPFFIRYPKALRPPGDVNTLTANIDFMPTILDLCGVDLSTVAHCDFHGRSLKPLLTESNPEWPERTLVTDSQRLVNPVKWRKSAVMSERWRLINGAELYDIIADRGQESDISDAYPDVVAELREAYDRWWDIVSKQFEAEIPIHIGSEAETPTCLTSHDWRTMGNPWTTDPMESGDNASVLYSQGQIRQGVQRIGYHEIYAETSGTYRFELRRWPAEENRSIQSGLPISEANFYRSGVQEQNFIMYEGGVALPIREAFLEVIPVSGKCGPAETFSADPVFSERCDIAEGQAQVAFTVPLQAGSYHLTSGFEGEDGLRLGAYYVYVFRIDK